MARAKTAYVWWNAGICHIVEYPSQKAVCQSKHFRRATRRARNLGYNVKVYCTYASDAPLDAVKVRDGSYILPRARV